MTREEVRDATIEAVQAADALASHLERLAGRMSGLLPTDAEALSRWDDDPWERLHALLRMFEQLFDLTSRKLFRGFLFLSGETIAGLSAQNQFRRMEALGAIESADRWIEIGVTRNILVHDYPTNAVARAQRANRAWSDVPTLIAAARQTTQALHAEKLI